MKRRTIPITSTWQNAGWKSRSEAGSPSGPRIRQAMEGTLSRPWSKRAKSEKGFIPFHKPRAEAGCSVPRLTRLFRAFSVKEIVAHALVRAVSPLLATPVFISQARRRHEFTAARTSACVTTTYSVRHWRNPGRPRKPAKSDARWGTPSSHRDSRDELHANVLEASPSTLKP